MEHSSETGEKNTQMWSPDGNLTYFSCTLGVRRGAEEKTGEVTLSGGRQARRKRGSPEQQALHTVPRVTSEFVNRKRVPLPSWEEKGMARRDRVQERFLEEEPLGRCCPCRDL